MFIAAFHDKRENKVMVWERNEAGQRVRRLFDPPHYFYAANSQGTHLSITNVLCKKIECTNMSEFDSLVAEYKLRRIQTFETDFSPLERVLTDHYSKLDAPKLVIGFVDIEVDYDPSIGFAGPMNPYAPINAVTIAIDGTFTTLAVPPKSWPANEVLKTSKRLPSNIQLFKTERQLLEVLLDIISKCDVLSGWNSEFFDLPYIAKRVELVLGKHALDRLALEGGPSPRWSEKERFKHSSKKELVIDLQTRVHLDYLRLFQKFDLTKRQSYSLDNVSYEELGIKKVEYEGSLHELYNRDFERFIEYNIHDVTLLTLLDAKKKYIELANRMVHEATVNFAQVFGSVNLIDTAIINFAHNKLNKVVIDKSVRPEGPPVEGALVMTPKPGFYEWIASIDINSLYPSTIRSLNLSPEKIVGQLLGHEAEWRAFSEALANPNDPLKATVPVNVLLDGADEPMQMQAIELVNICKDNKYAVSGFGTILDQSAGEGLLPAVLTYWFKGRKEMQAEKKKHSKLAAEAEKAGDKVKAEEHKKLAEYYDMLQGVRKVLLNSAYGALLNEYMRFGDPRLGASTTYSGRQISTCMINTVASCLNDMKPKLQKQ